MLSLCAALVLCAAVEVIAQPPEAPPTLQVWYSPLYTNNAVVSTPAAVAALDKTYAYYGDNLAISASAAEGLEPLNFYTNPTTNHTITTASAAGNAFALANGFALFGVQGYVSLTATDSLAMPLEMWYSSERNDHFLVGTAEHRADAQGAKYVLQYVDSWVPATWVVWPNTPPTSPTTIPFPPSTDLVGFSYLQGGNAVTPGIGADTWYPSWAANGKQYSSWTDGVVDGIHSSSGGGRAATTGYAIITGDDPFNLTLSGVATYRESTLPYGGRYPSLNHYRDGVWYFGTYSLENYGAWPSPAPNCGNWCIQGPFCSIRTSTDEGATWTDSRINMTSYSDNLFGETAYNNSKVKFGAPHAIDFGQESQHAPGGHLYIVGHGAESPTSHQSWMQGDSVYMARTVGGAPNPATVNTAAAWEFYAGGQGAAAVWAPSVAKARPLVLWPTRMGVVTMSYHPTLAKYVLVISTPTVSPSCVGNFDTYFLEADDLTGPWSYVSYAPQFGPEAYFVHIPSKFMAPNLTAASNAARASAATEVLARTDANAPVLRGLRAEDAAEQAAAGAYYSFHLSYSADFASGKPNPPGSGYHWSLLHSRFGVTPAFEQRLKQRRQAAGGEGAR